MTQPKDYFMENRNLFSNAQTQPEKFNLYSGLAALCNQIDNLEQRILNVERNIALLVSKIR